MAHRALPPLVAGLDYFAETARSVELSNIANLLSAARGEPMRVVRIHMANTTTVSAPVTTQDRLRMLEQLVTEFPDEAKRLLLGE